MAFTIINIEHNIERVNSLYRDGFLTEAKWRKALAVFHEADRKAKAKEQKWLIERAIARGRAA